MGTTSKGKSTLFCLSFHETFFLPGDNMPAFLRNILLIPAIAFLVLPTLQSHADEKAKKHWNTRMGRFTSAVHPVLNEFRKNLKNTKPILIANLFTWANISKHSVH